MAFTDLDELEELLGYGAGQFDKNWASGALRSVQDGYSYRDVPKFTRRTDDVTTTEISTWRKRMPPRGVRFAKSLLKCQAEIRAVELTTNELDALRAVLVLVRAAKNRNTAARVNTRLRLALSRAAA